MARDRAGSRVHGMLPAKRFHAPTTCNWLPGRVSDAVAVREVADLGIGTETAESVFRQCGYRCRSVSMLRCSTRMTAILSPALTKKAEWCPTEYFR